MHKTYSYLCKVVCYSNTKTFQKEAQIWANPQIPRDFDSVRNFRWPLPYRLVKIGATQLIKILNNTTCQNF